MINIDYHTFRRWFRIAGFVTCALLESVGYAAETNKDEALAYREVAPGLLERIIYRGTNENGGPVQIVDIMVGPRHLARRLTVEPAALLDVQAGNAVLTVNGQKRELPPGQVLALKSGETIAIDNQKQPRPFVARVIRFTGSAP